MTAPRLTSELGRSILTGRIAAIALHLRALASTEVGGWIVVGVLLVCAVIAAGAAVVLPRLKVAEPALTAAASPAREGAPPGQDMADFTLAPDAVQDIGRDAARAWNAALPISTDPIRPAAPFFASPTDIESYGRALDCLTAAIYYEAASETAAGQAAVAQVVLNRVRHPAYPRTVCGVVFEGSERTTGCQFSFTCDGAMARTPSQTGWDRARAVATAALNGHVERGVGAATHYHADWVAPYWAPRLSKVAQVGAHIFYRWTGAWGLPSAFGGVHAGAEPVVARMASLSTIAFETPVEVLDASLSSPLETETASSPIAVSVVLPAMGGEAEAADRSETVEQTLSAAAPESLQREIVLQRDAPIMADPLANPIAPSARRRQRIAAPSGW